MRVLQYLFALLLLPLLLGGCKKLVETEPENVLDESEMYKDVFDADAAVMGLYGKFMHLAEQYVVLNELRADLMSTTVNASQYLNQLNEHGTIAAENPYTSPRAFYEVILNCNDILYNLDIMRRGKKLKEDQYSARYSDVAALRAWVYLQVGIHFGRVPYITSPLSTVAEVAAIEKMPRIEFPVLLDSLIASVDRLPTLNDYIAGTSLITTVDGYATDKFFINKQVLKGQLYLWRGKGSDYTTAATAFKTVLEIGGTAEYDQYRIRYADIVDHNDLSVGYVRYREWDETQLINNNTQGWRSIFSRGQDKMFGWEWIWFLPFTKDFAPTNPFINLFSNRGGSYLVKPSQTAIDNWNSQVQKNELPYDARGKVFTWQNLNGQPVIMKYLYNYLDETSFTPVNLLQKEGKWFLYRAASLHLDFAEAANRDNKHRVAYALLNQGVNLTFGQSGEGAPYNFDGRTLSNPTYRADWYRNAGIRGRAMLKSAEVTGDSTLAIENSIVNEAALELAYEGRRWSDLVRIALRRNDAAFLADKVYAKLLKDNNPQAGAVRAKLLNKENWYLPFIWK
ncbi:hypothetical protein HNQ91_000270 [Filimonas zeae]|uniref:RagB/SusD domain-containing protein n=1 Tax=Filimonas zeae TaxID=1737353 RepID=A0A917IMM3_9BACT|nr:RagB/SusD family nutrient uptake outer membrane protein [Filimonas zeae]MDR6337248.1 hypothetical protein [Filimonas zeae]GGH57693.1 hypothetical protein GCM10011379_02640 [Filimonas zeae]